ncbi:hypothetical protein BpHYR1_033417 [Brachionus plicatilis]|uniref:Uncharacterized protein n=1 Tax=Brachionus plicatilis TaxID=10195 RepID=A0A3M7R8S7_BRAPC|nr:hypothetical protein BpHYR1_033417 [Brachionus plicatilis]
MNLLSALKGTLYEADQLISILLQKNIEEESLFVMNKNIHPLKCKYIPLKFDLITAKFKFISRSDYEMKPQILCANIS